MGMEQETLIYIEENDKKEARVLTQSFASKEVKSRAYINALGAELGMKYLALENINNTKTYNLHSVHKILEEMDISDIMLSNIHIDVRVIFDENLIFIPKSHFEYDILPDIYLVLNLSEDHSHAKFLGFFEPKLINKNNQNSDYYFIEKEKLSSPVNLKEFIENFKGSTTSSLSSEENDNAEMLMVSLLDQNVSKNEMKELLKYLAKSVDLRDKFIEFENFEVLSYKAEHSPDVIIPKDIENEEPIDATLDDIGEINDLGEEEIFSEEENSEDFPFDENEDLSDNTETLEIENENQETSENSDDIGDIDDIGNINNLDEFDNLEGMSDISELEAEEDNTDQDNSFMDGLADLAEGTAEIGGAITTAAAGVAAAGTSAAIIGAAELGLETAAGMTADALANAGTEIISGAIEANDTVSDNSIENISEIPLGETDLPDLNEDLPSLDDMIGETDNSPLPIADEASTTDIETQDINTLDTVEIPPLPDNSGSEMEVLDIDISNIDAVPNNLDANISETIEFNNIEATEDEPCSNEVNMETTRPTMDINSIDSFNGLEPINSDDMDFSDNSVDLDQLSAEPMEPIGQMGALPMDDIDQFAPVDLENINLMETIPQNNGAKIQQQNEEIENSLNSDELDSSLDEIPDFGDDLGDGLGGLDEISDLSDNIPETSVETAPSNEINPIGEEISDFADMSELENLTVDDIVETTVEEDITENDNAETSLNDLAGSEISDISELSEVSDIPDENPEFSAVAGLDDLAADNTTDEADVLDDISGLDENNELTSDDAVFEEDNLQTNDAEDDNELTMLFNENPVSLNNTDQIQNLESPFLNRQPKQNNNMKVILVAVVAALVLGGTGLGLMLKNKHSSADLEPLAQSEPETEIPAEEPAAADNSDILANTPQVETIPAAQQEPANIKEVKPAASAAKGTKPINPPGTYVTVKKLSWEVPDYLSYSNNITKYLQTAGKSIKLSLSSDLLLTSEYAYSNQVKVAMTLSNDGNIKDINIVKSSGSDQINKIVLQTVKDTLNVIKPATGEVPTPEFKLGLTINF